MSNQEPSFTIGIEEEYLLVDKETRALVVDPPDSLMSECEKLLEGRVSPEFLQSQIEVGTRVCNNVKQAAQELAQMRQTVAEVAGEYGLAPIAASTHPFADWYRQKHTDKERYNVLAQDMQAVARRLVICGMHVHVGIEDPHLRIDLMNQVKYMLPHMLALSASSPFWNGEPTGLLAYRLVIFKNLPRTGIPEEFVSWGEYERYVEVLVGAGLIEDATKLWWDIRPSLNFPTLEMRVSDMCTRLDDAMTIAAIYQSMLAYLYRLRRNNQRWRTYPPGMIDENIWRAQRYGSSGSLVDFGRGELVPMPELIEEFIELLAQDAVELDTRDEIRHARTIVSEGTSAHRQLATYEKALSEDASKHEALQAVVDELIVDSMYGIEV